MPTPQRHRGRNLLINFGLLILAAVVLFILLTQFLRIYTHHGESLTVPDFKGRTIEEVAHICAERQLRYEIKDSVFAPGKPKLSVIEQNPKPGAKVKMGRRIYLIINGDKAPKIPLPNIVDVQLRQAERILSSYGIKVGKTEYRPDIALNAVLEVHYQGRKIEAGDMVEKGSEVDLVLGDGGKTRKIEVPDLTGRTLDEAIIILRGNYLNIGSVIKDPGLSDSTEAIIYKQNPLAEPGRTIPQGEAVDVWLKPE